jgi:hypothetical protein
MKTSTFFSLMAEFGTAVIELDDAFCSKYLNKKRDWAVREARKQTLPFPVFKTVNEVRSGRYFVNAQDLADFLDQVREQGKRDWEKVNL